MSNGIINLSIYNFADNVVVCMLGRSDWCSGSEDHSQFPWPSFNSHGLVYIQFLQTVNPGVLSLVPHLLLRTRMRGLTLSARQRSV